MKKLKLRIQAFILKLVLKKHFIDGKKYEKRTIKKECVYVYFLYLEQAINNEGVLMNNYFSFTSDTLNNNYKLVAFSNNHRSILDFIKDITIESKNSNYLNIKGSYFKQGFYEIQPELVTISVMAKLIANQKIFNAPGAIINLSK